jgi:hyperosmotically inducible periplasmic protein
VTPKPKRKGRKVMKRLFWSLAIAFVAIAGAAAAVEAQKATVSERVDDAAITTALKTKLVADRAKNLIAVNVDTEHGVVRLKGTVPTDRDKMEAERLARATKGVVDVKNDLKVEAAAASPKTR